MNQPIKSSQPRARARNSNKILPSEISTATDDQEQQGIRKNGDIRPLPVSQRLLESLAERFPPERIVGYIEELLEAKHTTNGGKVIRDNRAFESAVKLLLAYQVGLPVQRQEVVQVSVNGNEDVQGKILASPALRAAIKKKIKEAEAATSQAD